MEPDWQWACREEHIPEAGDYIVYDVGPYSVLVVRTGSGRHQGLPQCVHASRHEIEAIIFRWKQRRDPLSVPRLELESERDLQSFPCEWDFPHVDPAKYALGDVRVGRWGGFIFINLDPNCISLEEYLAPLPQHVNSKVFEDRYIAIHVQKELNCNWKVASEAFLERIT